MGLMDREHTEKRHIQKTESAPRQDFRQSSNRSRAPSSYRRLFLVPLYLLVACIPVILYLQMPIPTYQPSTGVLGVPSKAASSLKCGMDEIKLDANKDGIFSTLDIRPLILKVFALPVNYVNSNSFLTPIAEIFVLKDRCDTQSAMIFNGVAWLLSYLVLIEAIILIWNLTQLFTHQILFKIFNIFPSTTLLRKIYWVSQSKWSFSTNVTFPALIIGGVMVVGIISVDSPASVSSQRQPRATPNIPQQSPQTSSAVTRPASRVEPVQSTPQNPLKITSPVIKPPQDAAPAILDEVTARLENIKNLLNKGLLSQVEYEAKKKEILTSF